MSSINYANCRRCRDRFFHEDGKFQDEKFICNKCEQWEKDYPEEDDDEDNCDDCANCHNNFHKDEGEYHDEYGDIWHHEVFICHECAEDMEEEEEQSQDDR